MSSRSFVLPRLLVLAAILSPAARAAVPSGVAIAFEENRGQTDGAVRFLARTAGATVFLTDDGAVLKLPSSCGIVRADRPRDSRTAAVKRPDAVLRMTFERPASDSRAVGVDRLPAKSNYFIGDDPGRWRTGVPNFAKVRYPGFYSGIDLVYHGAGSRLEFDLILAPGADVGDVVLNFEGAERVRPGAGGDLLLSTPTGELRFGRPGIYQEVAGKRRPIAGNYVLLGGDARRRRVGFAMGPYDPTRPLVIDPVLVYSTYLGGDDRDFASGIAADAAGNAYVTGWTQSSTFPGVDGGSIQPSNHGEYDAFVTKIDASGSRIVYSTFLGGGDVDEGSAIAVDAAGNAYLSGATYSTDFPTVHPLQAHNAGGSDVFVAKIDPEGSALVYSTYLGGAGAENLAAIAVDGSGSAYVTGGTSSTDFPGTSVSSIQSTIGAGGASHGWVAKLAPAGSALVFSTYLGGSGPDRGQGIALDPARNVYVGGRTSSPDFIGTASSTIQKTYGGGDEDGFLTKINAGGTALVFSTFLGGSGDDALGRIAVDAAGNAYVAGTTDSIDFPGTSVSPLQKHNAGKFDGVVAKVDASGSHIVYATYLGGDEDDEANGIVVDSKGDAWIGGVTASASFPGTAGSPIQGAIANPPDGFFAELSPAGSAILFSSYLGGDGNDRINALALDPAGNVYVAGETASSDLPGASASPIQPHFGGGDADAFVAKFVTAGCSAAEERFCIRPVPAPVPVRIHSRP